MTTDTATRGRHPTRLRRTPPRLGRRRGPSAAYQMFLVPIGIVFVVLFLIPLAQTFYYSLTDASGYSNNMNRRAGQLPANTDRRDHAGRSDLHGALHGGDNHPHHPGRHPARGGLEPEVLRSELRPFGVLLPAIPSLAILGLVWGYILSPLASGALNSLLESVFSIGPFPWLSDDTLARASVIGVALWSSAGWHAVIYLAYLQSIPADYYESATVDGSSRRQQFFHITRC